ncbi:MAG: prepilin-type N-terminal cleavage/methylation domain-containing protein [Clostridia bacterium]
MKSKKGFTLTELIAVMVIIAIFAAIAVPSLINYIKYGDYTRNADYAKTLFLSAQAGLTKLNSEGGLESFILDNKAKIKPVPDFVLNYYKSLGANTKITLGNYPNNTLSYFELKMEDIGKPGQTDNCLYKLLLPYVFDPSILNASICIEFNPKNGQVYSVFYTDKADSFQYLSDKDKNTNKIINITPESSRVDLDTKMNYAIGYYDSDIGEAAVGVSKLRIMSASLINSEMLTFKFKDNSDHSMGIKYTMTGYDYSSYTSGSSSAKPLFTIEFNGDDLWRAANANLKNNDPDRLQCFTAIVTPFQYGSPGTPKTLKFLPNFTESDEDFEIVLDAIDYSGDGDNSFSIRRLFGSGDWDASGKDAINKVNFLIKLTANDIMISHTEVTRNSNSEYALFGDVSINNNTGTKSFLVSARNARHLYNLRYCFNDSDLEFKISNTEIQINNDIDWAKAVKIDTINGKLDFTQFCVFNNGALQKPTFNYVLNSKVLDYVTPSFKILPAMGQNFTLMGNGELKNFYILNSDNSSTNSGTGLISVNSGVIKSLIISNMKVENKIGAPNVGSIAGINYGVIGDPNNANAIVVDTRVDGGTGNAVGGIVGKNEFKSLIVTTGNPPSSGQIINARTTEKSFVKATGNYVGGIAGLSVAQLMNKSCTMIDGSTNNAIVTGNKYVGGIAGVLSNLSGNAIDETKPTKRITINNCLNNNNVYCTGNDTKNIGGIVGLNMGNLTKCECKNPVSIGLNVDKAPLADNVGGVSGLSYGAIDISKEISAIVTGKDRVGGIVGYNNGSLNMQDVVNELISTSVTGNNYIGGTIGFNTSPQLGDGIKYKCFSNSILVSGKSYIGGIIGCNLLVGYTKGQITLTAGNIVGTVYGSDYFTGGLIGFNATIDNNVKVGDSNYNAIIALLDGVLTDQKAMSLEADLVNYTNAGQKVTFRNANSSLSLISGHMFVGGILGYGIKSDIGVSVNNTNIEIINQGQELGSYGAGIVAYNGGIIIESSNFGDISGGKGYIAGICAVNGKSGLVESCALTTTFGNLERDYIGGIVGLNLGNIKGCSLEPGSNVFGRSYLGGLASCNMGVIEDSQYPNVVIMSGSVVGSGDFVGGIVGVNGKNYYADSWGTGLGATITNMSFNSAHVEGRDYVGGMMGENHSPVTFGKDPKNWNCEVKGKTFVGGIVGKNFGNLTGDPVDYTTAFTPVTATDGTVGGVVGKNEPGAAGTQEYANIYYFKNAANSVITAESGDAGGIIGSNAGFVAHVNNIKNYAQTVTVSALNGDCGGIIGKNAGYLGSTSNAVDYTKYIVTGSTNVGGAVGYNSRTIQDITLVNAIISNYIHSKDTNVGGIAGLNDGNEGTINASVVLSEGATITPKSIVDVTNIGGIAGKNIGMINGDKSGRASIAKVNINQSDINTKANIGGVSGVNTGTITKITLKGSVQGTGGSKYFIGGIAGINEGAITNCTLMADDDITTIQSNGTSNSDSDISNVGGIVGKNSESGIIFNCYLTQSGKSLVIASKYGAVGGIVAINDGVVYKCGSEETGTIGNTESNKHKIYIVQSVNFPDYTTTLDNDTQGKTIDGSSFDHVGGIVAVNGKNNNKTAIVYACATGSNFIVNSITGGADSSAGGVISMNRSIVGKFTPTRQQINAGLPNTTVNNICELKNRAFVTRRNLENVGGIIGWNETDGNDAFYIENCVNYGDIYGYRSTGGIIGAWKYAGGTIRNCYNFGYIRGTSHTTYGAGAAGIVAHFYRAYYTTISIENCVNAGTIYATDDVAGIFSNAYRYTLGKMDVYLSDCVNLGAITFGGDPSRASITTFGSGHQFNSGGNNSAPYFKEYSRALHLVRCRNYVTTTLNSIYYAHCPNANDSTAEGCLNFYVNNKPIFTNITRLTPNSYDMIYEKATSSLQLNMEQSGIYGGKSKRYPYSPIDPLITFANPALSNNQYSAFKYSTSPTKEFAFLEQSRGFDSDIDKTQGTLEGSYIMKLYSDTNKFYGDQPTIAPGSITATDIGNAYRFTWKDINQSYSYSYDIEIKVNGVSQYTATSPTKIYVLPIQPDWYGKTVEISITPNYVNTSGIITKAGTVPLSTTITPKQPLPNPKVIGKYVFNANNQLCVKYSLENETDFQGCGDFTVQIATTGSVMENINQIGPTTVTDNSAAIITLVRDSEGKLSATLDFNALRNGANLYKESRDHAAEGAEAGFYSQAIAGKNSKRGNSSALGDYQTIYRLKDGAKVGAQDKSSPGKVPNCAIQDAYLLGTTINNLSCRVILSNDVYKYRMGMTYRVEVLVDGKPVGSAVAPIPKPKTDSSGNADFYITGLGYTNVTINDLPETVLTSNNVTVRAFPWKGAGETYYYSNYNEVTGSYDSVVLKNSAFSDYVHTLTLRNNPSASSRSADITTPTETINYSPFIRSDSEGKFKFSWKDAGLNKGYIVKLEGTGGKLIYAGTVQGTELILAGNALDYEEITFSVTPIGVENNVNVPTVSADGTSLTPTPTDVAKTVGVTRSATYKVMRRLSPIQMPLVKLSGKPYKNSLGDTLNYPAQENLYYEISFTGYSNGSADYNALLEYEIMLQEGIATPILLGKLSRDAGFKFYSDLEGYAGKEINIYIIAKPNPAAIEQRQQSMVSRTSIRVMTIETRLPDTFTIANNWKTPLSMLEFQNTDLKITLTPGTGGSGSAIRYRLNANIFKDAASYNNGHGTPLYSTKDLSTAGSTGRVSYVFKGIPTDYAGYYIVIKARAISNGHVSSNEKIIPFTLPMVKLDIPAVQLRLYDGTVNWTLESFVDMPIEDLPASFTTLDFYFDKYAESYNIVLFAKDKKLNSDLNLVIQRIGTIGKYSYTVFVEGVPAGKDENGFYHLGDFKYSINNTTQSFNIPARILITENEAGTLVRLITPNANIISEYRNTLDRINVTAIPPSGSYIESEAFVWTLN